MTGNPWFVLVESNTTGSGRQFCARARDRGMRPVVLTAAAQRYRYLTSDGIDHLDVDTNDPDAVLGACRALAGSGVAGVTSSSEYFIATAAVVAHRLGLPAPDSDAVCACRDKARQRQVLTAAGVPSPRSHAVTTAGAAAQIAAEIGFPVVVKPVSGSGSVGVRMCLTAAEVGAAVAALLDTAVNERGMPVAATALVEQFVTGDEYSVETFGRRVVGVTRKHLGAEPYFVETGHDFPAQIPAITRHALCATAQAALMALGLGWGAAHTELRIGPAGPMVIEVNPRLAGGMIPALVHDAAGVDLVDCCVALASGQPHRPEPVRDGAAAIRFIVAASAGRVAAIQGLTEATALPGVRAAVVTVEVGHRIEAIRHSFQDRLGYVLAGGPSTGIAAGRARLAVDRIRVDIDR